MASQFDTFIIDQSNPKSRVRLTKEVLPKMNSSSQLSIISERSESQRLDSKSNFQRRLLSERKRVVTEVLHLNTFKQNNMSFQQIENQSSTLIQHSNILLKGIMRDRLVDRFRRNILTNAYVLSRAFKYHVEKYINKRKNQTTESDQKSHIPLFEPNSFFIMFWDFVNILITLVILWITPFLASFGSHLINVFSFNFFFGVSIYLSLDILMNINRSVLVQGQVVYQRSKLIKIYLQNNFINDIISLLCWFIIFTTLNSNGILKVLATIVQHFVCYNKIQRNFLNHFESLYIKGNMSHALDLISLSISIYFYAHLSGCVWHYVSDESSYLGNSWLIYYDLVQSSVWVKYNYSFYWATMTMTTVGYGDITAQNQLEMIYSEVMMFFSSCVFAYSMNSIGIILKSIYDAKLKYKLTLIQINSYMSKHQVDLSLQSRIRNYLKYFIDKESNENVEDATNIVTNLPNSLKDELLYEIKMKVINKMKFLRQDFSLTTRKNCVGVLEEARYTPGDYIYKIGNQTDQFIYYIQEGEVQLVEDNSQTVLKTISSGDCFGYYHFFTGFPPKMTARSTGFTDVYRIERKRFLEILQFNKLDQEMFHHLKDQMIFSKNYFQLDLKCYFCSRSNHQEIDCPLIQYQPDMEQRIKKSNYEQGFNERIFKIRGLRQKVNSLNNFNEIRKAIECYTELELNNNSSHVPVSLQQINAKYFTHVEGEEEQIDDSNLKVVSNMDNQVLKNEQRKESTSQLHYNEEQVKKGKSSSQIEDTFFKSNSYRGKLPSKLDLNASGRRTTGCRDTLVMKEFSMLDELICNYDFQNCQIDNAYEYRKYMPNNNLTQTIKQFQRNPKRRWSRIVYYLEKANKYTFYYQVKMKALKIKVLSSKYRSAKINI